MATSNVAGKVVVITGASSGLGESTARLLAQQWRAGRTQFVKERIDAVVSDIAQKGGAPSRFNTDVTQRSDVDALVKGAIDRYGRLSNVLVNNSGIMLLRPWRPSRSKNGTDDFNCRVH